jgi:hypothetical protein
MNSWLFIRRLRGPAFIILVGITALLNQWGVLSFGHSWPLYLILAGVLALAERAAIAAAPPAAPPLYPGAYAPANYSPCTYAPAAAYPGPTPESRYAAPAVAPDFRSDVRPDAGPGAGEDPPAGPDRRS